VFTCIGHSLKVLLAIGCRLILMTVISTSELYLDECNLFADIEGLAQQCVCFIVGLQLF